MKKVLIAIAAAMTCGSAFSQNTFPANGNVTIGGKLTVDSTITVHDTLMSLGEGVFEGNVNFNGNIFANGRSKFASGEFSDNVGIDGDLVAGGVSYLKSGAVIDGPLKLDSVDFVSTYTSGLTMLFKGEDGTVQKAYVPDIILGFASAMYSYHCLADTAGIVATPMWNNGPNKLYTSCAEINVGIGTEDPTHKLHTAGNSLFTGTMEVGNTVGLGQAPSTSSSLAIKNVNRINGIELNQTGNTQTYAKILSLSFDEPTTEIIRVTNTDTANMYSPFVLEASGKLTIHNGTEKIFQINPDGLAQTREVMVDLEAWPDYVFENDYQLMPLSEVESYIAKEGHLPNIPSAKILEAEGLKLGEMNKLLMEKIEELTLHLIEQDKKITMLQQQINTNKQ